MDERRILVVEDETIVAMDIARILASFGYAVSGIAAMGELAVRSAEEIRPDLVLMDVRLKGNMDGIEAGRIIRERLGVPIVFLTAHTDSSTVARILEIAPHGYLVKPFQEGDLHRAIEMALARDSQERDRADEADRELIESREIFKIMVDSIEDYALILLDLEGRIVSWNAGAQRMTGFEADEVIGRPVTILFPEVDRDPERLRQELAALRASRRQTLEARRVRKNGSSFEASIVRVALADREGSMTAFAIIFQDVTARRSLEAQLLQAQKLDSLGKLAGGIAHDFNNMLMVVFSRCDLLLRQIGSTQPQRRYLEDIRAAATRSSELTQQILASAKRQVMQPKTVDLNEIVSSSMELLGRTLGEHVHLKLDLQRPLWSIHADPAKLHQVLLNLALNARDAMPEGGVLSIESRNLRVDDAYMRQRPGLTRGEYVALVVSDSGTGIPAAIRDRIYDPFFTTKSKGTGLGLAVVRGIVEQTGGRMWVYSEEQRGTTFKILLPRKSVDVDVVIAETDGETELPHRGTETILLVEDEQLLLTIVREALEEQGYRVLEADSPKKALELCNSSSTPIDLLLSDVVMPGMNGPNLAREITRQRPDTRVLFMSGYADGVIVENGMLDETARFVEKPISTNALLAILRRTLDGV